MNKTIYDPDRCNLLTLWQFSFRSFVRGLLLVGCIVNFGTTGIAITLAQFSASSDGRQEPNERRTFDGRTGSSTITRVQSIVIRADEVAQMNRFYTGLVHPARSSEVGFKQLGMVTEICADHGDFVNAGDLLARQDYSSIEAELTANEARQLAAQSLLKELEVGPRKTTIEAARARTKELQAERDQLRSRLERYEKLVGGQAISVQDIEDAKHQLLAAENRLESARQSLAELIEGTRPERIDAQRAEIAQLKAQHRILQIQLEDRKLYAPYDAIISHRHMDEGTVSSPGQSVMRIVDRGESEAWVGLPPEAASQFNCGDKHTLEIGGQNWHGIVKSILPELDIATRTRTVIFRIAGQQTPTETNNTEVPLDTTPLLPAGQVVRLNNTIAVQQVGFWLPITSLTRGVHGLWSVMVVVAGKEGHYVERGDVEVIQIDSHRVLVRGTLRAGDRIVVSGVERLAPGQRIEYIDTDIGQLPPHNQGENR